jgi:hypothetical protein
MPDVHPTLEAVARAIRDAVGLKAEWEDFLPEARAALNALVDTRFTENPYLLDLLHAFREIAAEPKLTVEDVLTKHQPTSGPPARRGGCCTGCDWSGDPDHHIDHQAAMLREAGLLKEDA